MKKYYTIIQSALMLLLGVFILSSFVANAQENQITDGKEYWFGIPNCARSSDETVRWGTYPIELWISSKVNTSAMVKDAAGLLSPQTYPISANKITVVQINDNLENKESEVLNNYGIYIKAKDPITVGVFVAYKWSGEAFRVTPVEWLGKKYFTLNMFQDQVKMHAGPTEYKPAQILITATQDNTEVTYKPTAETESGVLPGQEMKIVMQKGQTYLIKAKVLEALKHDWRSDLSGSMVKANKPISVLSGHTKGSFPRFSASMFGIKADFVRNMMVDMMWPVELLGKEYVSAPIKYRNRVFSGAVDNERGDIVRIVATEDGTNVYIMKKDGSGLKDLFINLKAGQWADVNDGQMEEPAYYRSNKPILVGHYGKSWVSNLPPPNVGGDDEELNPSKNGEGMLMTIAPIERWTEYAVFKSPAKMDNYVYITFPSKDLDSLKFDGKSFTSQFGTSITRINGTDFSFLAKLIGPGDHNVEAKGGAKFAAYAYGNWDYQKDGFAYGYPVGINYAEKCDDSLTIKDTMICGRVTGKIKDIDLQADTSCASIFGIFTDSLSNYNYIEDPNFVAGTSKEAEFTFEIIKVTDTAFAKIEALTRSGKRISKTFTYIPETIKADPTYLNYQILSINESKTLTFNLINNGRVKVTINELKLKHNIADFVITPVTFPIVLQPGQSKLIEVTATAKEAHSEPVIDSIIAVLSCYEKPIVRLEYKSGDPDLVITDAIFGKVLYETGKNLTYEKEVTITNYGTLKAELYRYAYPYLDVPTTHFKAEGLETMSQSTPLVIEPKKSATFKVFYTPDGNLGKENLDTVWFTTTATKTKLYSVWQGEPITAGPTITSYDWQRQRVIDSYANLQADLLSNSKYIKTGDYYTGTITIGCVGNMDLDVQDISITNDVDGVFSFETDPNTIKKLVAGETKDLVVRFTPKAEKDYTDLYNTLVTIKGKITGSNEIYSATGTLKGIGILPHINTTDLVFDKIKKGEVSDPKNAEAQHPEKLANQMQEMTMFDLKIIDDNGISAAAFKVDPTYLDGLRNNPVKVTIDDFANIPVIYTANDNGLMTDNAKLVVVCDAPMNDKYILTLEGSKFFTAASTTPYTFKPTFIKTTSTEMGVAYLINNGSEDLIVNDVVFNSPVFNITKYYNTKDINNIAVPITLAPNDSLRVDLTFTPDEEIGYDQSIQYKTSISDDLYSRIQGTGKVFRIVVSLPDKGTVAPGDVVRFDYKIRKDDNEKSSWEEANINQFKAWVTYLDKSKREVVEVSPIIDNTNPCASIFRNGTLTNDWNCNIVSLETSLLNQNKDLYYNSDVANKYVANDGVLFQFDMLANLRDLKYNSAIALPLSLETDKPYVIVRTEPGLINIGVVCNNAKRIIDLQAGDYEAKSITPSPVTTTGKFEYSIALDATTTISVFNTEGELVTTLLQEKVKAGSYELTFNPSQVGLSSGVYFVKIQSGYFTDVKEMVIAK